MAWRTTPALQSKQPRRGVSPPEELREAERAYAELRELSETFGELNLRDDALSGLAQAHLENPASPLSAVEEPAFAAILQRTRLPFGSDGLGFFENLVEAKRERWRE